MNIKSILPTRYSLTLSTYEGDIREADIVLIGIPAYIKTKTFNPYLGPTNMLRIIRDYVEDNSILNLDKYYSDLKIYDAGDVYPGNYDDIEADISAIVHTLRNKSLNALYIGGEHTITYYLVKYYRPKKLVILDAHLDLKDTFNFDRFNSATYLRRIQEDIKGLEIYIIGARGYDKDEYKFLKENENIELVEPDNLRDMNLDGETYLSIDVDVIDPIYMESTVYLEPNGLSPTELMEILETVIRTSEKILGIDIVEYNPRLDRIVDAITMLRVVYETALLSTLKRIK